MSRQSLLDNYFKTKSGIPLSPNILIQTENTKNKKRCSLSLIKVKTPKKSPKTSYGDNTSADMDDVIAISSDESVNLSQSSIKSEDVSDISQKTTSYSWSEGTPKKTPQTASSFQSPGSKDKYFSPNKKRTVLKRTPVKRNLATAFGQLNNYTEDEDFTNACEGMDDKTIFLITIINKYVKDNSLNRLLDESSHKLLCSCMHVTKPGMRLVCRLYWRQHGWYRRDKLAQISSDNKNDGRKTQNKVMDDPSIQEMLNSLVANGLISAATKSDNCMSYEDFTKVLKSEEIKQICKDLKLKIQSKQNAINALSNYSRQTSISKYFNGKMCNNSRRVIEILRAKAGPCYKLSELARSAFYKLNVLMYLGMNYSVIREKKLELMLINDKIKREVYPIDKEMTVDNASVVFRTKEEFIRFVNAHIIYENFLAESDLTEKRKAVLKVYKLYKETSEEELMRYKAFPVWLRKYTPSNIYVKILEAGIQELKKDKTGAYYDLALDILTSLIEQIAFRQHKKAEWYAEKALILHKLLNHHNEAAEVLLEGFKSNLSEEAKDSMRPRANKIANQQNIVLDNNLKEALLFYANKESILEKKLTADHITKQPVENSNQRGKIKFEIRSNQERKYLDAEEYCIVHYTCNGHFTNGEHWEGRIATTIFFLLFWDIIYTKPRGVNGIFLSHYQVYPLDMFTESFYINRKTLIDDFLITIERSSVEQLLEMMHCRWEDRPECELSGITRSIGWENIHMVTSCLGAKATAAICRRLATNYGYTHSGFPDLTLWNIHTKKIKFVEVKTDSDKPSMKQLQWMHYLQQNDIDTGFCYVGVNTTRAKSRPVVTPINVKSEVLL